MTSFIYVGSRPCAGFFYYFDFLNIYHYSEEGGGKPLFSIILWKEALSMFTNQRYLTRGVDESIPPRLQALLWNLINLLPPERDYLQVFSLSPFGGMQQVIHTSEEPEYKKVLLFPSDTPVTAKVYVIDDNDHCTKLLAEEY